MAAGIFYCGISSAVGAYAFAGVMQMKCNWESLLTILPHRMRLQVDNLGKEKMDELRLRINQPVEMVLAGKSVFMPFHASEEDLNFIVNAASRYSPWASTTTAQGYLTVGGGHRIGLCGECVIQNGLVSTLRKITSMSIRVARCFCGIAENVPLSGSILILGPPGSGKTTLLREIIRLRSENGQAVAVVDERGELFPCAGIFPTGPRTDVLTGCSKPEGMIMVLRTMGPTCIAVDEITSELDCRALLNAAWCGVELLATAHASDPEDLIRRRIYRPLVEAGLFQQLLVMDRNKCWRKGRANTCTRRS